MVNVAKENAEGFQVVRLALVGGIAPLVSVSSKSSLVKEAHPTCWQGVYCPFKDAKQMKHSKYNLAFLWATFYKSIFSACIEIVH